MGRLEYLTRLALGRSAFADLDPKDQRGALEDDDAPESPDQYVQEYDAKGRPINPRTEAYNAQMRDAMNDVLSLTPVVERKDADNQVHERQRSRIMTIRHSLLVCEHERGEVLEFFFMPWAGMLRWWPAALLQRVQVGLYAARDPFSAIVAREVRSLRQGNPLRTLVCMFPGIRDNVSFWAIRVPLELAVEQATGKLQSLVVQSPLSVRTTRRLHRFIFHFAEFLAFAIDAFFLPLHFHNTAQRLGLAPPLQFWPRHTTFWPWDAMSIHRFAWKPTADLWWPLGLATSPAFLLLLVRHLQSDPEEYGEESPRCLSTYISTFRYRDIDADDADILTNPLEFWSNPFGWLMYRKAQLRQTILHWAGWNIVRTDKTLSHATNSFENNTTTTVTAERPPRKEDASRAPIHRSTVLAHLPAMTLASIIDVAISGLITLPLESLMLRAVATCYMSATDPRARQAAAVSHLYRPFGGPLSRAAHAPWAETAAYASKLGLAWALKTWVDLALFGGVYYCARADGLRRFGWGVMSGSQRNRDDGGE